MTDPDDKLRRAYRDLAREEPPASLDAAILARARDRVVVRRKPSWMVPVSIAAVLVLGIGVSLRMQMEEPGIETSMPAPSSVPETHSPAPAAQPATALPEAKEPAQDAATSTVPAAAPPQKVEKKAKDRVDFMRRQENIVPSEAPAAPAARMAPAPATIAAPPASAAGASANAPAAASAAPDMQLQAAPQRAKREAESDSAAARELKKSIAVESDPARELERIAQLRTEGKDSEADAALEAFRRRFPGYRIPDAVWDRVKPR